MDPLRDTFGSGWAFIVGFIIAAILVAINKKF